MEFYGTQWTLHGILWNSTDTPWSSMDMPWKLHGVPWNPMGLFHTGAKLIMASWRDGTKKQYSTYITMWQKFCNQRQISHIQPSVVSVLDFLTLLYQQGRTYSAINTARSALSSYITLENGTCVGKHPLVSRLMKGIFQQKPPRPKYTEIWDVSFVLSYLQSLSPVDNFALEGTYTETCCASFISFGPKRSDRSFAKH